MPRNGGPPRPAAGSRRGRSLHRLRAVREQEGLSLRTVARHLGITASEVRRQEQATADIPLSRLYKWRDALNVPLIELLMEPSDSLSPPLLRRAQMIRLMKTALSILQRTKETPIRRMAEMLVGQLTLVMPELRSVGPWPVVGQRRRRDEYGRAGEHTLPDEVFLERPE